MMKKTLVALLATIGGMSALPAFAADTLECSPPVVQVRSGSAQEAAQYVIHCRGTSPLSVAPSVTVSGEVFANGTPPYRVAPTYTVDIRDLAVRKLNQPVREDQLATGTLQASTVSIAALPAQLASQTIWDASTGTLSVEEQPGRWHVFSLQLFDDADTHEESLVDAGYASVPYRGRATAKLVFGKDYSRFAGRTDTLPVVNAELGLREGKLELLVGDSRVASESAVQGALLQLDRKPKDITRAWALASRAQFLGLFDEVRYAEQKVAAHNPDLLEEFQRDVQRIKPYVLPKK